MTPFKQVLPLCSLVFLLVSCGGSDEGARLASETRKSDPAARALFNAALAAEKSGEVKKALKWYRNVTDDYPLFTGAHEAAYRRGRILEKSREPIEAFAAYNDILTKYPASPHYAEVISRQEKIAHAAANGNLGTKSFLGMKSRVSVKKTAEMLSQVRENAPRSESAEKAQFTIGRIYQKEGTGATNSARAVDAYRELTREYPNSKYAPVAQYQIGKILLAAANSGNQDTANLDRARETFDDLLIRYPDSKEAKLARTELAKLSTGEIERTFNIAEFYRKKDNIPSALFYYQETVNRSKSGPLRSKAQGWINELSKP